jgi:hypothetical protein
MIDSKSVRRKTRGHPMRQSFWTVRHTAASALLLVCLTTPTFAGEETVDPALDGTPSTHPSDPLSLIPSSIDTWLVSRTAAGCFLISPRRPGSSGLAIGRHATLGLGLFMVRFPLAVVSATTTEPVVVQIAGHEVDKSGRMPDFGLFFVPLGAAEVEATLHELRDTGMLWLKMRRTWIAHGGRALPAALAEYEKTCTEPSGPSG